MSIEFLDKACELLGGQGRLAHVLGISSPSITEWRARQRVPLARCRAIEAATAGRVTVYQLRPDVFGEADAAQMQRAS